MISILKKIPWWGWVTLAIAIFFLWQSLSGWAASRKLYDMALDNLRVDQSKIVETLGGIITERERELATIYEELDRVKQQQAQARAETEKLKGKIRELQAQRENILVPEDPDRLVDELRRFGISSAHRIKR
jgi:seryl-tRNA synthetase